ncbi:hypothetical protein [Flavobacterium salmonis]|uniref:Uncharacterized protein n=1 Tax=Flavobacterium salmonis TaxID=2654844 RepID=A0A6V6Z152_9FLAO|nr:hypothetical protein [Flavobacterium salmonis]CAD0005299.1 hypothetical protein FLAT13_02674 [Flavobacterium salmonis]
MKESILKFVTKPQNIFLLDGFGALLTTLLFFFVLRTFNDFFGLSKKTLEYLASLSLVFSIYSISCYFLVSDNLKSFLKIICTANILYCVLTFGTIIFNYQNISIFGMIYFLGEIIAIGGIVYLEIKAIKRQW